MQAKAAYALKIKFEKVVGEEVDEQHESETDGSDDEGGDGFDFTEQELVTLLSEKASAFAWKENAGSHLRPVYTGM